MLKDSRKIAAILAADIVGYSRLMGLDEAGALSALKVRREIFDRLVEEFDGQEFGSVGDSLMAQFPSAINAVRCAQSIQHTIAAENESLPAERRMSMRIGVNLGDVIDDNGALFGDGVNIAARLQALAAPGGVLISGSVYEQVKNKLSASFTFLGARPVKNIAEPVPCYEVREPVAASFSQRALTILKRRVVIAAAAYVFLSWLLVSAVAKYYGATGAPPWTLPALITLLAAGFVPALAVASRFDRRRWLAPWIRVTLTFIATVLCCVVVWFAWHSYFTQITQNAITRPVPKAQPVIAVADIQNLTGDPKLDWLSDGVANLVRDGLAESSHLVVVSPTRWQAVLRNFGDEAATRPDVLTAAGRAGIDYVLSGEFLSGPGGLLLTARLSDVRSGVEMEAHRSEPNLTPQTLLGEAARLVLVAKRGLRVPHTENVASYSADFAVNNMAAYEAFLGGIGYFLRFDYRSAERALRSAINLAPEFHMARYRLAHVQAASGDTEAALATLNEIPADAPLTRRERLYIDGARALFERDATRAKAIYTTMLAEFPFDVEARLDMAIAHDLAIEDEAAIADLKGLLDQEPENDYVWTYLGETYLRLGDYEHAREALDRYLKLQPRDPFGFTVLGQLDQLTGKLAGAAERFAHALKLQPGFVPARLALAQTQVLRNDWADAERLLRDLAEDREAPVGNRIDAAFDLSAVLRAEGRFAASLKPLTELEPQIRREQIREAMALAERGLAQAELGRFADAEELVELAIARSPGSRTRYLFARGSLLLMRSDAAGLRAAAVAIRSQDLRNDNQHDATVATENAVRAADYLDGMADLLAGETDKAVAALTRVAAMPGYQYSLYKLGLARALLAQGKRTEALELTRAASTERDPGDIRLDLELDRSRALLLEAQVLAALGERREAMDRARGFLRRWSGADPGLTDRVRAERLAATGRLNSGGT